MFAQFNNILLSFLKAYKQKTETAKREYLKKLAAYRASLVSKVTCLHLSFKISMSSFFLSCGTVLPTQTGLAAPTLEVSS